MPKNRVLSQRIALAWLLQLAVLGAGSCREKADSGSDVSRINQPSAAQTIAEANEFYRQRDDLRKVRSGVALLRQARIADYGSYEAAWRLAQFNYFLGMHTTDELERDAAFREGIEAGKSAVKLQGGKPEGHFWLGANYGGSAEHSTLAGLSSIEDIRREMEAVLKIDERYQGGSAYLALGELYLKAPRFLGGDYQKAVEYLEKGLRVGSDNALLRLRLAEAYYAVNRKADARKQIDFILAMTPDPDYMPEYKEAVDKSKLLLEKLNRN